MTGWRLVSDVGGSNVRFARCPESHRLIEKRSYALHDFGSFYDALSAYLSETGGAEGCVSAAICVAGPIEGNRVKLTNAPWTIDTERIRPLLGGGPAKLLNDLEAVAIALPYLGGDELEPLGNVGQDATVRRTMLALNVGTGFGGASIIPSGDGWIRHPGEPGHMCLGALNDQEAAWLKGGRSVEDVLSGRGVEPLYHRIASQMGRTGGTCHSGAEIFANAGNDEIAHETVRAFGILLGRIAGDLVLATAAWGGVFLTGSVVRGWAAAGGGAYFRAPFEDKGPMTEIMKPVYSGLITRDDVALVGLTYLPVEAGK